MASRSTVLVAKDISKSYGDRIIIDHLSLTVHEGEAVALTGRNGAGKSTVLRMLVGADRPSSGTIEVLGKKRFPRRIRSFVATLLQSLTTLTSSPICRCRTPRFTCPRSRAGRRGRSR
ncbi:ABC transporter ATP-binding protein [Cutibacterium acnes JCM 18918]|nr:ABC transporter ATP-binding protein [Cutibacterium acnes JCM 18918]